MRTAPCTRRSGFTLIEIIVAILIIGVLMALLIVGFRLANQAARQTVEKQNLASLKVAIGQFRQEFGFPPPLVKDGVRTVTITTTIPAQDRIAVYSPIIPATGQRDLSYIPDMTLQNPVGGAEGPYSIIDQRYSVYAIPYYILGVLEQTVVGTAGAPPIDGVSGPGSVKPRSDGTFEIPAALLNSDNNDDNGRTGKVYQPFFAANNRGATVGRDSTDDRKIELRDRNGIPFRYYRWINGDPNNALAIVDTDDYNVPALVGNPADDPQLRDATFAIVAAGSNKLFGDEPINVIFDELRLPIDTPVARTRARQKAAEDNVVEVGK